MENGGRIEFEPKFFKIALLAIGFMGAAFLALAAFSLSNSPFAGILAVLGALGLFAAYKKKFPGTVFDFKNMLIERNSSQIPITGTTETVRMADVRAVSYDSYRASAHMGRLPVISFEMKDGSKKVWAISDEAMCFYLKEMCERCGIGFNMEGLKPYSAKNGFAYADNYKSALGLVVFCAIAGICSLFVFRDNFVLFAITGVPFLLGMLILCFFADFFEITADSSSGSVKMTIIERKGSRLFLPKKTYFEGGEIESVYMRLRKGLVHFGINANDGRKFDVKSEDLNSHTDFKQIAKALGVKFIVEGVV